MKYKKIRADFAVRYKEGQVKEVGHSIIYVPKPKYSGKGIKWLDETKYRRIGNEENEERHEKTNCDIPGQ